MDQEIQVENWVREREGGPVTVVPTANGDSLKTTGLPAGGSVRGLGIKIDWQDGPLGRGEDRKAPNGAFVEGVIKAAASRLHFYQASKFACDENAMALRRLEEALEILNRRTAKREERAVEGTHEV